MKKIKILITGLFLILLGSCGGPDLIVINSVNTDGSVSRRVIMTHSKDDFDLTVSQVPVDSTWAIDKSMTLSEKGDSIWTLIAEKTFESVDEINRDYKSCGGPNGKMNRFSVFRKEFRWFSTNYYFSENISKAINGYPPEEFFTEEELEIFYMPQELKDKRLSGIDSLKYQTIIDSIDAKEDSWLGSSIVRAAIIAVSDSDSLNKSPELKEEFLFSREKQLVELIMETEDLEVIDSVYGVGFYKRNQVILDTAFAQFEKDFDVAFNAAGYIVQTNMPGELVATNGYIDDEDNIVWAVKGEVFLSVDYIMWAESTIRNQWARVVTILFILFVITGFSIRFRRNRKR